MCLLFPHVSSYSDLIVFLNPIYMDDIADIPELLNRMNFVIVEEVPLTLSQDDCAELFRGRFEEDVERDVVNHFSNKKMVAFYLANTAAREEIEAIFTDE